jgi:virulence factor Mce-like protein
MIFRRRKGKLAVFDNPILVGAVTILVTSVAVYLSYIAENGLPFIPTYDIKVDVPNADELVKNADVRIGGARVGQVLTITPEHAGVDRDYGQPFARLTLQLNQSLDPLPYNSTYQIRLASVLGGKYLEIIPGSDRDTARTPALQDGGTFTLGGPVTHNEPVVDIDQAFRTFGPATQAGIRNVTAEAGDSVAGRGAQFNDTIYQVQRLMAPLENLLRLLAAPTTNLARFISGASETAGALAPVAPTISALLADGATTFQALSRSDLGQAIDQLPATESLGTTVLARAQPLLSEAADAVQRLKPGAALLPLAAQRLDQIIRAATPVFELAPELAGRLQSAIDDVNTLATNPAATATFRVLGDNDLATLGASAFVGLGAILEDGAQAQLGCNTEGIWVNNVGGPGGIATQGDSAGTWLRSTLLTDPSTLFESATPAANLHLDTYPTERPGDCEAGNEHWQPGQDIGQPVSHANVVPHTAPPPGVLGLYRKAGLEASYK